MADFASLRQRMQRVKASATLEISAANYNDSLFQAAWEMLEPLFIDNPILTLKHLPEPTAHGVILRLKRHHSVGPVTFWGTPSGFQLEGLVLALEAFTGTPSSVLEMPSHVLSVIQTLTRPIQGDLFVTPT